MYVETYVYRQQWPPCHSTVQNANVYLCFSSIHTIIFFVVLFLSSSVALFNSTFISANSTIVLSRTICILSHYFVILFFRLSLFFLLSFFAFLENNYFVGFVYICVLLSFIHISISVLLNQQTAFFICFHNPHIRAAGMGETERRKKI